MSGLAAEIADFGLVRLELVILIYFLVVNSFYLVLLVTAQLEMRRFEREGRVDPIGVVDSPLAPRISLLAPAYNEAATIQDSVRALLTLDYPNLETIIVNDGSTDDTLRVLQERFDLTAIHTIYWRRLKTRPVRGLYRSRRFPHLLVVDKENGGKADALNAGLNQATGELVCALDADTLIEPDALQRMVRPFLIDPSLLATGGTIRVANASRIEHGRVVQCRVPARGLAGFQVVEYLRAFLFGRLGWNRLGGNLIISGAFGLFRREPVIAVQGYRHDTVGEDMELVVRLRRHGYETGGPTAIQFIPDPVAWTEVPAGFRVLGRQRDRWQRGLADVVWRHRRLLLNPRYGSMGLLVYPYFVLAELLAPVVEAVGLAGLGVGLALHAINRPFAILFFLAAYGYGLVLTFYTLLLEEINFHRYEGVQNRLLLLVWALIETVGYRQLTVFWRLRGLVKFFRRRTDWGVMERRGFVPHMPPPVAPSEPGESAAS